MKLIEDANVEALKRILEGEPKLLDVVPAHTAIKGLKEKMILHAGPPITWDRMCGPMRGAVAGAIVFEGWAPDLASAEKLAASGGIEFHPNHHFDAVGPMTGMTTVSMPVFVVENARFGNRAYCAINEGLGKVMRFGGNDESVIARLRWLRDVFGPELSKALRSLGSIELKSVVRGHDVQIVGAFEEFMGHAGAIVRHPDGLLEGACDPRSDGAVAAR